VSRAKGQSGNSGGRRKGEKHLIHNFFARSPSIERVRRTSIHSIEEGIRRGCHRYGQALTAACECLRNSIAPRYGKRSGGYELRRNEDRLATFRLG
jgi:hypothetical protein